MATQKFGYTKLLRTTTIHYDIVSQYDDLCIWIDERANLSNPEFGRLATVLTLFVTRHGGCVFMAREHVERTCKLIEAAGSQTGDELHPDARLLAQLRDLSGRQTRNGGEIAAIRRRQNRGE